VSLPEELGWLGCGNAGWVGRGRGAGGSDLLRARPTLGSQQCLAPASEGRQAFTITRYSVLTPF